MTNWVTLWKLLLRGVFTGNRAVLSRLRTSEKSEKLLQRSLSKNRPTIWLRVGLNLVVNSLLVVVCTRRLKLWQSKLVSVGALSSLFEWKHNRVDGLTGRVRNVAPLTTVKLAALVVVGSVLRPVRSVSILVGRSIDKCWSRCVSVHMLLRGLLVQFLRTDDVGATWAMLVPINS